MIFNGPSRAEVQYYILTIFDILNIRFNFIGYTFTFWDVITCSLYITLIAFFVAKTIMVFANRRN